MARPTGWPRSPCASSRRSTAGPCRRSRTRRPVGRRRARDPPPARRPGRAPRVMPAPPAVRPPRAERQPLTAADPGIAPPRPIRAVIFDLDGVIVDSEIWWDEVRSAFAAAHGRVWTLDDRDAVMG